MVFFIRVTSLQTKDDERGPHALSTTSRKKQESSFVLSSQDVLDAVTLENDQLGMMANRKCHEICVWYTTVLHCALFKETLVVLGNLKPTNVSHM